MSEKSRIRWLCRRGMKELDVLLERFMESTYDELTAAEKNAFETLLRNEDPDLYALLMQKMQPANEIQARIIERIGRCARVQ